MKNNELTPIRCGCGGEAKIYKAYEVKLFFVACKNCQVRTTDYDSATEAIEAWNKAMGGVVTYPSTTPNGVYTSGCTTTNTIDPNKDFHPVRDFMVKPERTAKVFQSIDEYRCPKCFYRFETTAIPQYCPKCGARLEWE